MYEKTLEAFKTLEKEERLFMKKTPAMIHYNGLLNTMIYLCHKNLKIYNLFKSQGFEINTLRQLSGFDLIQKVDEAMKFANWMKTHQKVEQKTNKQQI